jgi:uncharacterized protein YjbI with pentapeptide repeats
MSPEVTAAIIAAGASVTTLIGTVIAQIIGFRLTKANTEQQIAATHEDTANALGQEREHLEQTLAEQRVQTLNERFATAAEQLGSDKPAVRLAGVYALSGLADDWVENRQTCVDVLCAYLRMPYEPDPGQDAPEARRLLFRAIREVRHTVTRVITAHLEEHAAVSWQGLNFDFTGAVFDCGDFVFAQFSGGEVSFSGAQFSSGEVNFNAAEFSGARVDFSGAQFSGGTVDFRYARFSGGEVDFRLTEFSGGTVHFYAARFSGAEVYFHDALISGGEVDFKLARFTSGKVRFRLVEFSGGEVSFSRARFSGSEIHFEEAKFSGGTVDFSDARDWSCPPTFSWTGTPPSGLNLPQAKS